MLKLDDLMVGNKMFSNNYKGFVYFFEISFNGKFVIMFYREIKVW